MLRTSFVVLAMLGAVGCSSAGSTGGVDQPPVLSEKKEAPVLTEASALGVGRSGTVLRLSAKGTDANGDVTKLFVKLTGKNGQPLLTFDTDFDGKLDSAESVMALDLPVDKKAAFTAVVTFPDLTPDAVSSVELQLVDHEGMRSSAKSADVKALAVLPLGSGCDKNYLENRCEDGLGCSGSPAKCQEGVAPEIDRVGYFLSADGPRVLVEGVDPDDDLWKVRVGFLDSKGLPLKLDLDNDGQVESNFFDVDAMSASANGKFFVLLQTSINFGGLVAQVSVEPYDKSSRKGLAKVAPLAPAPPRTNGQPCDRRGFDTCITDYSCTPGIAGASSTCQSSAFARTKKCEAAPVIEPAKGVFSATGMAQGVSLWDPPVGCAANDPHAQPEAVARLVLAKDAAKVTLTTLRPGTGFDTVLTLLPDCSEPSRAAALACNDDGAMTAASTLVATNLKAGTYLVVVDARSAAGGSFELTATVE